MIKEEKGIIGFRSLVYRTPMFSGRRKESTVSARSPLPPKGLRKNDSVMNVNLGTETQMKNLFTSLPFSRKVRVLSRSCFRYFFFVLTIRVPFRSPDHTDFILSSLHSLPSSLVEMEGCGWEMRHLKSHHQH